MSPIKVRRELTPDGGAWECVTAGRWDRTGRTGYLGISVVNHPRVFPHGWTTIRDGREIGRYPTLRAAREATDQMLANERTALGRHLSLESVFND